YEDHLIDKVLDDADVITCTLVGSTSRYLASRKFYTVIIDEAAQALEAATWIPITKGEKVILAGDPYQLPPTIKSTKAGLQETLLERCIKKHPKVNLLDTQYRMNEKIMNFSNKSNNLYNIKQYFLSVSVLSGPSSRNFEATDV
ncbi:MAG: hypothetical protein GY707_18630, partial [Desulfobacteraceae bacterium]|nr:hypothetical protein [Desulfobacteraceae bacterium]